MNNLGRLLAQQGSSESPPVSFPDGVVTQVSPLLVAVGADPTGRPAVSISSSLVVGSKVVVMVRGADRVVVGPVTPTYVRWELSDNTPQSVANGATVDILWDTEFVDTADGHVAGAAAYTAPVSGVYLCDFSVQMVINATGVRAAWMLASGSTTRYGYSQLAATNLGAIGGCSPIYLAAGDTVRVQVFQNSGGALNFTDAGTAFNHFNGVLLT